MKLLALISMCILSAAGYGQAPTKTTDTTGHRQKRKAYVLRKQEGEVLNDPRGRKMLIKVSPESGAAHLSMGATEMPKGTGIFVHRHEHAEEILFVHSGNGLAVIDGDSIAISEGSTLFIPPGTWHGVNNPTDSMNILFNCYTTGAGKDFPGLGRPTRYMDSGANRFFKKDSGNRYETTTISVDKQKRIFQ